MPPRLLEELKRQLKVFNLYPILDTFILPTGAYTQGARRAFKWSITAINKDTKEAFNITSKELTASQCSRGQYKIHLARSTKDQFTFFVLGSKIRK